MFCLAIIIQQAFLPYSYPRYSGEIVLYDRKHTEDVREIFNSDMTWDGYNPLFPFGWGLSYTKFTYGPISLSSAAIKRNRKYYGKYFRHQCGCKRRKTYR